MPPGMFRLCLAAAVVLAHISTIDCGRLAVMIFFFLSGYWTTRIWNEKFDSNHTLKFYLSRFLRIYPLYIIVMISLCILLSQPISPTQISLLGVASSDKDLTGVSWSLDVELQYYLLVPFIAAYSGSARLQTLALSIIAAVFGWWAFSEYDIRNVFMYIPAFTLGAMVFSNNWKPSERTANWSIVAFIVFTLITMTTPFWNSRSPQPFNHDFWAFLWMLPLLPYAARSLTVRSNKLDRHLGNLSFPLYLVHLPIIRYFNSEMGSQSFTAKGISVASAILLTLALYFLIDRPLDRVRVRLTETKVARPEDASPTV